DNRIAGGCTAVHARSPAGLPVLHRLAKGRGDRARRVGIAEDLAENEAPADDHPALAAPGDPAAPQRLVAAGRTSEGLGDRDSTGSMRREAALVEQMRLLAGCADQPRLGVVQLARPIAHAAIVTRPRFLTPPSKNSSAEARDDRRFIG